MRLGTDSRHKSTAAIDVNRTALERLNAEKEREISAQEKANQLKERELELYREKWNIDNPSDINKAINEAILAAVREKVQQSERRDKQAPNTGACTGISTGSSGGVSYVNNITIPGVGQGTTRHADDQSARTEVDWLRRLAMAKGVAQ